MINRPRTRPALDRAAMTVVRYYAALRLSAGSATLILPANLQRERPPIVRASPRRLPGGYDRREVAVMSGRLLVVTIDAEHSAARDAPAFSLN